MNVVIVRKFSVYPSCLVGATRHDTPLFLRKKRFHGLSTRQKFGGSDDVVRIGRGRGWFLHVIESLSCWWRSRAAFYGPQGVRRYSGLMVWKIERCLSWTKSERDLFHWSLRHNPCFRWFRRLSLFLYFSLWLFRAILSISFPCTLRRFFISLSHHSQSILSVKSILTTLRGTRMWICRLFHSRVGASFSKILLADVFQLWGNEIFFILRWSFELFVGNVAFGHRHSRQRVFSFECSFVDFLRLPRLCVMLLTCIPSFITSPLSVNSISDCN